MSLSLSEQQQKQALEWAVDNSPLFRELVGDLVDLKKERYSRKEMLALLSALAMTFHHIDELRDVQTRMSSMQLRMTRVFNNLERTIFAEKGKTGSGSSEDHQEGGSRGSAAVDTQGVCATGARARANRKSDRLTPHWAIHA